MNHEENTKTLIREIVERMVQHPDLIRLAFLNTETEIEFALAVEDVDEPVMVGRRGTHVDALTFLVLQIGMAVGKTYALKLLTKNMPVDREPSPEKRAEEYDPRPTRELLCRILEALDVRGFTVEARKVRGECITYEFHVAVNEETDYMRLTVASGARPKTVQGTLRTLLWIMAKQDGVKFFFMVDAPQPFATNK